MRKSRYRYKRYLVYLPKSIGDVVDTKADYFVQLFGPAIVLLPKGLENFLSRLEKLEKTRGESAVTEQATSTDSSIEDSRMRSGDE
jgi:hypothetical protein